MRNRWLAIGALGTMALVTIAQAASLRTSNRAVRQTAAPRFARLKAHPLVAITFDDLPAGGSLAPGHTRANTATTLVAELRARHLKNVYGFVNAVELENDSDAQEALHIWLGAHMNIGSHTWSHPSLSEVSAEDYEHNIALNEPALRSYADGRDWHWFRYPYLEEGDTLAKREDVRSWLREHHYRIAEATLNFDDDSWDDPYQRCLLKRDDAAIGWLRQSYLENAEEFIRVGRQEEQIAFGHEIPNVLLLHETAFTTLMLPDLLDLLHKQGFRFATLARVERDKAYSQDPGAALRDGGTLPNQYLNSRHLQYPPFTPEPYDKLNSLCR
jgi:peptidoglycan-N-acetylglucosamine deacetylase